MAPPLCRLLALGGQAAAQYLANGRGERHAIVDAMALRTYVCPSCDTVETGLIATRPIKAAQRASESRTDDLLGYCGYDDESTSLLGAMFDSAWAKLKASGGPLTAEPLAGVTRELLARCIIALGRRGAVSNDKLDEKALLFLACLTRDTTASRTRSRSN